LYLVFSSPVSDSSGLACWVQHYHEVVDAAHQRGCRAALADANAELARVSTEAAAAAAREAGLLQLNEASLKEAEDQGGAAERLRRCRTRAVDCLRRRLRNGVASSFFRGLRNQVYQRRAQRVALGAIVKRGESECSAGSRCSLHACFAALGSEAAGTRRHKRLVVLFATACGGRRLALNYAAWWSHVAPARAFSALLLVAESKASRALVQKALARWFAVAAVQVATRAALQRCIASASGREVRLVEIAWCRWECVTAVAHVEGKLVVSKGGHDVVQALATSRDAQEQLQAIVVRQRRTNIIVLFVLLFSVSLQLAINELL
jgi:hypothetical protein